jgi:hypothetical protein
MKDQFKLKVAPTFIANIYVAGDLAAARQICQEFCLQGLCVTIQEIEFVYTGGRETGVIVGLINYPRFPSEPDVITRTALDLAQKLVTGLHQGSASVVTSTDTIFISRREGD